MNDFLNCVMDIGEQMLVCGAEVHRVEDSIERMCYALGAKRIDVFIITSSMVVTVYDNIGSAFTQTRRIKYTGTDFEKLHKLNELSRKICREKLSTQQIEKEILSISESNSYTTLAVTICYAVIAGSFTMFFGGSIAEAMVSFVIGAVVRLIILLSKKAVQNKIFTKFLSSFAATALAFFALKMNLITSVDKVLIGNIMSLIPGIGFTNALRDLFMGDSVSGLLRLIEAMLTALSIAAGYFAFVFISGGYSL